MNNIMKYLKITNEGEIQSEAFTLVGASTKRNDETKIGMFGSGNKYAIAFFLRNNYNLKVISGENEILFDTIKKPFGNEVFDVITVNGKETSLTAQMGPKWKLWQSVREIYSNAIDEGLIYYGLSEDISEGKEGETSIYIELNQELQEMFYNSEEYFAFQRDPIFECEFGKIYKRTSDKCIIYRKGIRCFDTNEPGIFDYDFNEIDLTEDRIVRYNWQVPQIMWKILQRLDDLFLIRKLLNEIEDKKYFENKIDDSFVDFFSKDLHQSWKLALNESKIVPRSMGGYVQKEEVSKTKFLPSKLYNGLIEKFGDELKNKSFKTSSNGHPYLVVQETVFQKEILKKVKDFFNECGFEIPYDIRVVDFKNKSVHGSVEDETILIDVNAFDSGKVWVANIIIEEYIHIKFDAADETRKFQDSVITEFLTYMQISNSYML